MLIVYIYNMTCNLEKNTCYEFKNSNFCRKYFSYFIDKTNLLMFIKILVD